MSNAPTTGRPARPDLPLTNRTRISPGRGLDLGTETADGRAA